MDVRRSEIQFSVGGIVLCGGQSRRMGTDKARLPFGPQTLLERVVERVSAAVDRVVIVGTPGRPVDWLPDNILVVYDEHPHRGPLQGIATGMQALESTSAVFVCSCDLPFLNPRVISRLVEIASRWDIVVPVGSRGAEPLCAVYSTRLRERVSSLLEAGVRRPIDLFPYAETLFVPIGKLRDIDTALLSFFNVNTPDDYRRALALAGISSSK